jgi:transposase InsO family protein
VASVLEQEAQRRPAASDFFASTINEDTNAQRERIKAFNAPVEVNDIKAWALIDTGADTSALSLQFCEKQGWLHMIEPLKPGEDDRLGTFHKSLTIERIGTISATLVFGNKNFRAHSFEVVQANEDMIVGMDLFEELGLSLGGLPIHFPSDRNGIKAFEEAAQAEDQLREPVKPWGLEDRIEPEQHDWLMAQLSDLLAENAHLDPTKPACPTIPEAVMRLPMQASASYRHQYPLPNAAQQAVRKQVHAWIDDGVVEQGKARSNFNSALLAVGKKNLAGVKTDWRICVDFRHINALLTETFNHARDRMPHLHEALAATKGFTMATSLDLRAAFNQFEVAEEDREKTTFTFERQRYQFARWPFGLNPASLRLQKAMEIVLEGLEAFVVIWIDDILIYTKDGVEDHAEKVKRVLERLNEHGLIIKPEKCHFGYKRVLMLGHFLSGESRAIDPLKVSSVVNWPTPATGKHVQKLLGFTNFIRDYIPLYARMTQALEPLKRMKHFKLEEQPGALAAFENLKKAVTSAPVLQPPLPDKQFQVACDASQQGLGAILYQQEDSGERRYIAFAAGSLKGAQKNYGATKRELLAVVFALRAFHNHIYGRKFTLFTDHSALTALFTVKKLSYVLQDWLDTLLQYSFDVVHRPGVQMVLPDTLSRLLCETHSSSNNVADEQDFSKTQQQHSQKRAPPGKRSRIAQRQTRSKTNAAAAAARQQAAEQEEGQLEAAAAEAARTKALAAAKAHAQPAAAAPIRLEPRVDLSQLPQRQLSKPIRIDELSAYPNRELAKFISERHMKVLPPEDQRAELLTRNHATLHRGAEALFRQVWRDGFFWPSLRKDCRERVAFCRSCIAYNISREGFHPMQSPQADAPFDHIAVDSLGPLTETTQGNVYVLILVDVRSRFLVTRPLPDLSMATMARTLYEIFTTFGPPKILQSDNGTEYVNRLVEELCQQANVDKRAVAPFNPRANGLAEAFVKIVKQAMKKTLGGDILDWDRALPGLTYAINTHDGQRSKTAPFTMFFGRRANAWADYTLAEVLGPDIEKLEQELNALPDYENVVAIQDLKRQQELVAAAALNEVNEATKARQQQALALTEAKRKTVARSYPKGATVFIINQDVVSKLDPLFVGPYTVEGLAGKSRAYRLRDPEGELLDRPVPISQLKWVSDKEVALLDNDGRPVEAMQERGILNRILDMKKDAKGQNLFLVEWKHSSERNQWLPASAFDDPSFLLDWFRRQKPGTKKRKTRADALEERKAKKARSVQQREGVRRTDLSGRKLSIPAVWFGTPWAKETYGEKFRDVSFPAVVLKKANTKDKWLFVVPKGNLPLDQLETFAITSNAVLHYETKSAEA